MSEMMICPKAGECKADGGEGFSCRKPHKRTPQCDMGCPSTPGRTTCVPYREFKVGDRVECARVTGVVEDIGNALCGGTYRQ